MPLEAKKGKGSHSYMLYRLCYGKIPRVKGKAPVQKT